MISTSQIPRISLARMFIRGKKVSTVSPSTQKVVNQLSAISASRKQPKLLKLCKEDLIKHNSITNAWTIFKRKEEAKRQDQLDKQFASIRTALDELKSISPELFEEAVKPETKRFPLELRVPTDFPANKPWVYSVAKPAKK